MKKLLFVHIPKTGGLSLNSELTNVFGAQKCIRFGDHESVEKFKTHLSITELKEYAYIVGYLPLNEFRAKGIDYPAAAILRNPIDRLLSMYNYLNQSDHPDHIQLKFEAIDNFIDYILNNDIYNNIQCQFIGGEKEHETSIDVVKNELIYVAPLPFLKDMIETLSQILGQPLQVVHINQGNKTQKYAEDRLVIEKKLTQYWEEDLKLYEFVQENYFDLKQRFLEKINIL